MHPVEIFISYRREDSAGYARAIGDALAAEWGAEAVFIDVDDIGAGQAFPEVIDQAVGQSACLLVLIGQRWLGPDSGGPSRLDDPADFVRREIEAAIAQRMLIVPVLLDGAAMPTAQQLPAPLQALCTRQALQVHNGRFAADMDLLKRSLAAALGAPAAQGKPALAPHGLSRRRALLGTAIALPLAVGLVWLLRPSPRPPLNGTWQAEVRYDWPGADFIERFEFDGQGQRLGGSASFLRVPRVVQEGRVDAQSIEFITRTEVLSGDERSVSVHRYRGEWKDGAEGHKIHFVMQTEAAGGLQKPVRFVARRVAAAER